MKRCSTRRPRLIFSPARLKKLMDVRGLNAHQVSAEMRCIGSRLDRSTIGRHLRGEVVPGAQALCDYADVLGVLVDAFVERERC